MSDLPDFSNQGYQVIQILGRNTAGGRVVYLAQTLAEPKQTVVIKQFQFTKGAGWSGFKAIEREMQVLQGLTHPGIPRYLGSLQTADGYCIIQEYKKAQPLSEPRSFDPDEIKQIAVAVLEILVYLQERIPPIIHRDIKPENVLVDQDLNVYLIDFGLARLGGNELAISSMVAGTLGFMAPEQIHNKNLTEATDLYSLGVTLIALLTQTKSTAIDTLIDDDGKISFKHLVPKLSLRLIEWLERMIAYKVKDRYPNAKEALEALKTLDFTHYFPSKLGRRNILIGLGSVGLLLIIFHEIYKRLNNLEPEMIAIPAGSFLMGSTDEDSAAYKDEKPQHQVTLAAFHIGKYPITQEQYEAVMGHNPSLFFKGGKYPVENVSWDESQEFCKKLSKMTGKTYRLPSEAQWEYAARAGTQTRYYFGDDYRYLREYAWYMDTSDYLTHPVGQKKPNQWGLYDMLGNVLEWCEDHYHKNYNGAPNDGSAWIDNNNPSQSDDYRITRGGSRHQSWQNSRCAQRFYYTSPPSSNTDLDLRYFNIGFRVVYTNAFWEINWLAFLKTRLLDQ